MLALIICGNIEAFGLADFLSICAFYCVRERVPLLTSPLYLPRVKVSSEFIQRMANKESSDYDKLSPRNDNNRLFTLPSLQAFIIEDKTLSIVGTSNLQYSYKSSLKTTRYIFPTFIS